MESEALAFHERVRKTYLELAARRGDAYRVIDAGKRPDEVFGEVIRHLEPLFEGLLPQPPH